MIRGNFFFSSRRRHTRCREVSWARRCVQETGINAEYMGEKKIIYKVEQRTEPSLDRQILEKREQIESFVRIVRQKHMEIIKFQLDLNLLIQKQRMKLNGKSAINIESPKFLIQSEAKYWLRKEEII
eukprot:TRINITY_DN51089_c0_g1_i1.p2 TRINITY_DN51089_c0_g1~~TRINITY_DN51089_c0_g1_i1.p2  ORF type:complete len:127 (+),score=45.72 TRINITY_DN51089_c0_g1_i1:19-399(+)